MCFCWPFREYDIESAAKKEDKKKAKPDWYVVQDGDRFYPVNVSLTMPNSSINFHSHYTCLFLEYVYSFFTFDSFFNPSFVDNPASGV